jgi:methylated-DNA-protein-cysteine methyltransferase-like protein
MKSLFSERVLQIIQQIPPGKVMSYGQVAAYAGVPRAARQVGWILNKSQDATLPWWRVLNNSGRITIKGSAFSPETQAALLRAEGISFNSDLTCNINDFRYIPDSQALASFQLPESYIQTLQQKYIL